MRHRTAGARAAALVLFVACGRGSPDSSSPTRMLEPGFRMFETPRANYAPGTIYRIDSSGVRFLVSKRLAAGIEVDTALEALAGWKGVHLERLDAFLGFLGIVGARQQRQRFINVDFAADQPVRETVSDETLDAALRDSMYQLSDVTHWAMRRQQDDLRDTYWIVRETVSATAVRWIVDKRTIRSVGVRVWFGARASDSVSAVSVDSTGDRLTMDQTFPSRLRVFYKAEEIKPSFMESPCRYCAAGAPTIIWERVKGIFDRG